MKKCLHCGCEVEEDDNFCPKCGIWTAKGYFFLKDEMSINVINGKIVKQKSRMASLFLLLMVFCVISICICLYRGRDILQPFVYVKRQVTNYNYGYNATILKTDNQYFGIDILTVDDARDIIVKDFSEQFWQCKNRYEMEKIEEELQDLFDIPSVSFCDMSIDEARKISGVIKKMYYLFPNIKGYLTNIAISNARNESDYVAYFQPVYQFVNSTNSLDSYNRVNKTQILLNSYYYGNNDKLSSDVKGDWYVDGANWESLIAHEFGHYITFVSLVKSKGIDNIFFVTKDNVNSINDIVDIINSGSYSYDLLSEAISNYNVKYNSNYSIDNFANSISNYASNKNIDGNYIYDEIIAEGVHDYYLHGDNANNASLEIVSLLKSRLR